MKKYATAYVSFFENSNKVTIVEAENEIEAMKKAILIHQNNDPNIIEWLDGMVDISIEDFHNNILQSEISMDVIEI